MVNQTDWSEARVHAMMAAFGPWSARVFAYLHAQDVAPLRVVITPRAGFGYYQEGSLYLPPNDAGEMLETWIHELTHHVTGHESSFFFKEGIASHTLEALFASAGRVPQGWPQYGVSNDAWVKLFRVRGLLPPLAESLNWPRREGSGRDRDFHSWQTYLIGASFVGWYLEHYGIEAFRQAFASRRPAQPMDELERLWLRHLDERRAQVIDPARQLPEGLRYRDFTQRLSQPVPQE